MNIDNMQAGRELDALVAVKVMGWQKAEFNGSCMVAPPLSDPRIHWAAEWDEYGCPHWMPRYSIDLVAAWEIIENSRDFDLTREDDFYITKHGKNYRYYAEIYTKSDMGAAHGNTMPLAICRAALKAVSE